MRRMLGLVAVAVAGLVAVAVVAPGTPSGEGDDTPRDDRAGLVAAGGSLVGFDACDDLLDHLTDVASQDPWGSDVGGGMWAVEETADAAESMAGADGDAGRSAPAAADLTGTSDTNVQVAGVDEPDLVETDGRRVWTTTDGRLVVVDVSGPTPERVAAVDLALPHGGEAELLRDGDRLLVLSRGWSEFPVRDVPADGAADMMMPMGTPLTSLVLFDVAGDTPVEVARADVEGELVAGRGVDGTVHLVVAHRPQPIAMPLMELVWSAPDAEVAGARLRTVLAGTTVTDWLPGIRTTVAASGAVTTTTSVGCADVVRPVDTADAAMLQVLTFDVRAGDLDPDGATAVLTDARHVTATATELVVATPVWEPVPAVMMDAPAGAPVDAPAVERIAPTPDQGTTRLHLFDLGPAGTTHRASGEVPGMLLNQFSMSLHDGTLRVATTAGQTWDGTSESGVTVLRREGDRLEAIGTVGGLGRGETIHAVRFLGDQAYVVTFRQTDPLYTIDLSDPTAPRVTGELKITGYSAYLHPLGDDRLLGVGQEATPEGMVTGTQVSVFDVADPAAPTRVSQVMLPGATSEAEWDHHAVLVHDGFVVLPYERWLQPTLDRPEGFESAAMVLGLDGDALTLRGTVASTADAVDPWRSAIRRVLVVDGRLVTVSHGDLAVHDPASLETTGTVAL